MFNKGDRVKLSPAFIESYRKAGWEPLHPDRVGVIVSCPYIDKPSGQRCGVVWDGTEEVDHVSSHNLVLA